MQIITSKDNEVVKNIRKLKDKKYRETQNKYIVEGIKLIEEAIDEKASIDTIVVCEDCIQNNTLEQKLLYEIAKYNCVYVSEKVFNAVTEVNNPQGILGTILRTVDSVGLHQIIVSSKTADAYNPKVVRSTMGAIYRVKVLISNDLVHTLKEIKKHKYKIFATSLETNDSIYDVDYKKKVIVIGNEANGVSKEILEIADGKIKIPMLGKTESLNASVATSVILYEYVRQKLKG